VIFPGVTETKRHSIFVIAVLAGVSMLPPPLSAQADTLAHATIQHWAEQSWLLLLDRNASAGGRLSESGVLQRFQDDIDDKYFQDVLSTAFTSREDYEWYRRDSGVRWLTGSVTRRDLISEGEFKTRVKLGRAWDFGVRFNKEDNPTATRNALRIGVGRSLPHHVRAFATVHLDPNKPGSDVEVGATWGTDREASATLSVTVMDVFNDLVFVTLDAVHQPQIDSTLVYEPQPIAFRTAVTVPIGRHVYVEAHGVVVTPATLKQYEGRSQTDGFQQRERIAYIGGMVELRPVPSFSLGASVTTIRAESQRERLSPAVTVDEYGLLEQTTRVGGFTVWRFARRWVVDGWILRAWRAERRDFRDAGLADIDYLLRHWTSSARVTYRALSGFTTDIGVGWDKADEPRGEKLVPATGNLTTEHFRIRYDFGWAIQETFEFLLGIAVDVDAERSQGASFGGGRGRFTLYW